MTEVSKSVWNSLEVIKLVVSAGTALLVVVFGAILTFQNGRIADERNEAVRQQAILTARYSRVVDKRIALWDTLGPKLNEIFAYNLEVGSWAKLKAVDAIEAKRASDQIFYAYRPFFTEGFATAYDRFMAESFQMYNGVGEDAKLRTSNDNHRDTDAYRFTEENNQRAIYDSYYDLLKYVGNELDTVVKEPPFRTSIDAKAK
jgi:hypothetical protein